jgi:hypothetical protein
VCRHLPTMSCGSTPIPRHTLFVIVLAAFVVRVAATDRHSHARRLGRSTFFSEQTDSHPVRAWRDIAKSVNSDKYPAGYHRLYELLLDPMRHAPVVFLEIGLGTWGGGWASAGG